MKVYPRVERDSDIAIFGMKKNEFEIALKLYCDKLKNDIYQEFVDEYGVEIEDESVRDILNVFVDKALTKGMELAIDRESVIDYYKEFKKQPTVNFEEYGWLSTRGMFNVVSFGNHNDYAKLIIEEFSWEKELKEYINSTSSSNNGYEGDFLVYKKNYILLHNPSKGVAFLTRDESKEMTKSQKEFLFDYYLSKGLENKANDVWNIE